MQQTTLITNNRRLMGIFHNAAFVLGFTNSNKLGKYLMFLIVDIDNRDAIQNRLEFSQITVAKSMI